MELATAGNLGHFYMKMDSLQSTITTGQFTILEKKSSLKYELRSRVI